MRKQAGEHDGLAVQYWRYNLGVPTWLCGCM
jgi:hypothetical protein